MSELGLQCLYNTPKQVSSLKRVNVKHFDVTDDKGMELTVLHSERPKLYIILAFLSTIWLRKNKQKMDRHMEERQKQ